ncbi:MAG TPA: lysylphosphatidylglycerol synthase transmembrane domain-containing protein [Kofleriaceae bacterium]|nr:lysylphosphatidylglycerol synthase transmembrane domain-containing protein [Kofleriaceae bacterium]
MTISRSLALRLAIAAVMVVLCVVYVRGLDWDAIWRSTAGASVPLLLVGVAGNIPLIWLKALRMRILVRGRVGTLRLMGFYVASYAADNLVMSQAGLGLRVALLRREGLPLATAVTAQALEKVLEGVGLALVAAPLVFASDLDPRLQRPLDGCLIIGAAGLVALIAVVALTRDRPGFVQKLADTTAALRDPVLALRVGLLTVVAWLIEVVMVALTMAALGLPVGSIDGPIVVLLAVNLAALVPGLPANVGAFEMAATVALGSFGVASEPALGFALVYHALHTIPVTLVGLAGLHRATRARRADALPGQNAQLAKARPPGN